MRGIKFSLIVFRYLDQHSLDIAKEKLKKINQEDVRCKKITRSEESSKYSKDEGE